MRKKLDTRFPAARIKKIMQADEDVGKIAMAVPVLVSKALELFLQDLCDRTYDITVQRGAKTVSALHLKHCIHTYGVFDFLKDVVSKVPDYGHTDAVTDDRGPYKRRKAAADECNDSDEELKKSRMQEMSHMSTSGRGRGRGRRGRGRGRPPEREHLLLNEVDAETSTSFTITTTATTTITRHHPTPYPQAVDAQRDNSDQGHQAKELVKESPAVDDGSGGAIGDSTVRNIDLNVDVASDNQNMAQNATGDVDAKVVQDASLVSPTEAKQEQFVSEVDGMAIDPHRLAQAQFSSKIEEDEDYDEE